MSELVSYAVEGDIALIGLNRPDKRNALSDRVIEALEGCIERAEKDAKAAVVFGHGRHFSAGLDLAEHAEREQIEAIHHSRNWHRVFDRIHRGKIPWVAALHGAVVGGGLELAASTHVRVADEDTKFALPEGQRGIFTGGSGSVRIARLIGVPAMTDMMLTGRVLDVAEAERVNMFQYRTPAGQSLDKAKDLAGKAAKNASLSNFAIIHALPRIQDMSADDGLFVESLISSITTASTDAKDRLNAFLEGRAARLMPKSDDADPDKS